MTFNVKYSEYCVRWLNWDKFLKSDSILKDQVSSCLCVFVTYNNSIGALETINQIKSISDKIDILIVDNNSNVEHYESLRKISKENRYVSLISTIENLGGAGGYSIGLEYFLKSNIYNQVIVTEDDVLLLKNKKNMDLLFSKSDATRVKYANNFCESFSFHYYKYSRVLIENCGVPDPNYFMIIDDLEFDTRVRYWIRHLCLSEKYLDYIQYYHPLLKPYNSVWPEYFKFRNEVVYYIKYHKLTKIFGRLLFFLFYSICKFLLFSDFSSIKAYVLALRDLIRKPQLSYNLNLSALKVLAKIKINNPLKMYNTTKINGFDNSMFTVGSVLSNLHSSNMGLDKYFNTPVIAGYGSPYIFLVSLYRSVWIVDSISHIDGSIFMYRVSVNIIRRLVCFFIPLLVLLLSPLIFVFIICIYLIHE